jgi:MFS family permease
VTITQGRQGGAGRARTAEELGPRYKWIALSNTTLGMLIATINSSIVLIALPDIFKGIKINPLDPANTSYLLWMIMGFLVVTAVLVVAFGRLGDMFGRAKMYNMGFAIFTVSSVFLAITWFTGDAAALWLIGWRIIQGVGGAFIMANSSAILTDAFPTNQRGTALGINGVAAIAGSFIGLVIGGVLAPVNWHLVFLVSVPIGVLGTVWAYLKLHDTGERKHAKMDWWGNITFAVGLVAVLVGITYGIQPYGSHSMGWTSPMVLGCIGGGIVVLIAFGIIETRIAEPLFDLSLFKIRSFSAGNLANLMAALGRGGLQFILIIWLQGIWLPQHGFSFESTPLWAGIYMLPMTVGFLLSAPTSGVLSDRFGSRAFSAVGILIAGASFFLLMLLPVNFNYWQFALLLFVNGIGMGLFSSPNRAEVMNSLPGTARGVGAGMTATFQNAAMVLSIGIFFSLIITGLSTHLPSTMSAGLIQHGVPAASAHEVANLPAVAVLFAAFLGYNPIQQLLGPVLHNLPANQADFLTGRGFFPSLISQPFSDGLMVAFGFAIVACVIAAIASLLCGPGRKRQESVGAELASVAGESGTIPSETVDFSSDGYGIGGTVFGTGGRSAARAVALLTDTSGHRVARVNVDSRGRYGMTHVDPGDYVLTVTAPGHTPQAIAVRLDEDGVVDEDFELQGASTLSGIVHARGSAVPESTVIAIDADGGVLDSTSADADGRFGMNGLPGGTLTVTASAAGHVPQALEVPESADHHRTVDIELHAVTLLSGRVLGAAGATVHAIDAAGDLVATVPTDADGRYVLAGLRPGDYTLVASQGAASARRVQVCSGEGTTADLEFNSISL